MVPCWGVRGIRGKFLKFWVLANEISKILRPVFNSGGLTEGGKSPTDLTAISIVSILNKSG